MEESSRFKAGYAFGSKVFTNQVIGDGMLLSKDKFGKCLAQVICDQITFDEHDCIQITDEKAAMAAARKCINASRYPTDTIRAFVELHIEQGPRLHSTSTPIGIVMAIAAPVRFDVLFSGQQNHSGTTPMDMRKDALAAASEAILVIEEICKASADRVVGTVGVIQVKPNVINVIPGAAKITIDLRSDSLAERNRVLASVLSALETISAKRKIRHEVRSLSEDSPVSMSGHIVSLIEANCARLDIPCARMNSWAGHDSAQIGKYVSETGMIFVPSRDGISHDPREWTDTADILQGAQVLMLTLLDLLQLQT